MKRRNKQNKGMSYLEVIICFLMISIVILPLSLSFVSSTKLREESLNLSQSTFYAETLLEEVKNQLAEDLLLKKQIEAGGTGILPSYLETHKDYNVVNHLKDYFREKTDVENYLKEHYYTQDYSYEVALWALKDVVPQGSRRGSETQIEINKDSLSKAVKWYTDVNYKFAEAITRFPTLILKDKSLELFKDELFIENSWLEEAEKAKVAKGIAIIKLESDRGNIAKIKSVTTDQVTVSTPKTINIDLTPNKTPVGYAIEIKLDAASDLSKGLLVIDARGIKPRELKSTVVNIQSIRKNPFLIKLVADNEEVKKKLHINFNPEQSYMTVEKTKDLIESEDYLIGLIIRNKNPKLGKNGKIVKTMLELYTFQP